MVDPDRSLLQGIAEVDEASVPCRDGSGAEGVKGVSGRGRSADGRILLAGAVELSECGKPRRIRLKAVESYASEALHGFVSERSRPARGSSPTAGSGTAACPTTRGRKGWSATARRTRS